MIVLYLTFSFSCCGRSGGEGHSHWDNCVSVLQDAHHEHRVTLIDGHIGSAEPHIHNCMNTCKCNMKYSYFSCKGIDALA